MIVPVLGGKGQTNQTTPVQSSNVIPVLQGGSRNVVPVHTQASALSIPKAQSPKQTSQPTKQQSNPFGDFVSSVYNNAVGEVGSFLKPMTLGKPVAPSKPVTKSKPLPMGMKLDFTSPQQQTSGQVKQTPQTMQQSAQSIKNTENLKAKVGQELPQTQQAYQQLKIDPLSLKANPKKAITDAWNGIKDTVGEEGKRINDFLSNAPKKNVSTSAKVGKGIQTLTGAANVAFLPLTALFSGANDIPVLGSVSKLLTLPFTAAGESATHVSNKIIDELPVSQSVKNNLKPGIGEIAALVSQLLLGKVTGVSPKKQAQLEAKFGVEDTHTIITKAEELAKEKTISPGTHTPQEVRNEVFQKGIEETQHGKDMLAASAKAEQAKQNITISSPTIEEPRDGYISQLDKQSMDELRANPTKFRDLYIQKFGNEVNTDNARTLFKGYTGTNSHEFQNAARNLKNIVNDYLHQTSKGKGNNTVLYTGGGPGVGKTSALEKAVANKKEYPVVIDSTMSDSKSIDRIQKSLDNNYKVHVKFVLRHPVESWKSVINRAVDESRTVGEEYHLSAHEDALKNIIAIEKRYKDNPNVDIRLYDNRGGKEDVKRMSIDELSKISYNREELRKGIQHATEQAGKENPNFTSEHYKGLTNDRPRLVSRSPQEVNPIEQKSTSQVPVGTGKLRQSQAYKRFTEDLEQNHPDIYESVKDNPDLLYNKVNQLYDFEKAANLVASDPQRAYNIAKGYEPAPVGQRKFSITQLLSNRALKEGDMAMVADLERTLSLEATRAGQEIYSLRGRYSETSPQTYIQQVLDERLKRLGGTSPITQVIDTTSKFLNKTTSSVKERAVAKIDQAVKRAQQFTAKERSKIDFAQKILDDLTC